MSRYRSNWGDLIWFALIVVTIVLILVCAPGCAREWKHPVADVEPSREKVQVEHMTAELTLYTLPGGTRCMVLAWREDAVAMSCDWKPAPTPK